MWVRTGVLERQPNLSPISSGLLSFSSQLSYFLGVMLARGSSKQGNRHPFVLFDVFLPP